MPANRQYTPDEMLMLQAGGHTPASFRATQNRGANQQARPTSRPYDFNPTSSQSGGLGRGSTSNVTDLYNQIASQSPQQNDPGFFRGGGAGSGLSRGTPGMQAGGFPTALGPTQGGVDITGLQSLVDQILGAGAGNETRLPGSNVGRGFQNETMGILNPSEFGFGFGEGVPGGDAVQFLRDAGFPDLNLPQAIQQGQALQPTNMSSAAMQLGGMGLPSPQSLRGLGPSGLQFLMGLYATMLGIPEEDIMAQSFAPFEGLGGGAQSRQLGGFIR